MANDAGAIVEHWWKTVPLHFPLVEMDEYVIMPNHFHGIVWIVRAGSPRPVSPGIQKHCGGTQTLGGGTPPLRPPTLGQIVGYFKYQTTKDINIIRENPGVPVWQRNYHERIVRDETELAAIRAYIRDNPGRWDEDAENPANRP